MTSLSSDRLFGVSAGLAVKAPARVATTGDIALTGLQVVDTEQLVAGDRVLAKHQVAASENGVYVADSGPWRRAADLEPIASWQRCRGPLDGGRHRRDGPLGGL